MSSFSPNPTDYSSNEISTSSYFHHNIDTLESDTAPINDDLDTFTSLINTNQTNTLSFHTANSVNSNYNNDDNKSHSTNHDENHIFDNARNNQKMKSSTPKACNECYLSKSRCSFNRPCDKCVSSHKAHLCKDRERKRFKLDNNNNYLKNYLNSLPNNISATSSKTRDSELLSKITSYLCLQSFQTRYPAKKKPNVRSLHSLLGSCFSKSNRQDFATFLSHLGYRPPEEENGSNNYSFSHWLPPNADWPNVPDEYIHDFESSPLEAYPDSIFNTVATIVIAEAAAVQSMNIIPFQNNSSKTIRTSTDKSESSTAHQLSMIVLVNQEFERLFGFTQAEMRSKCLIQGQLFLHELLDHKSLLELLSNTLTSANGGNSPLPNSNHNNNNNSNNYLISPTESRFYCTAINKWNCSFPVLVHRRSSPEFDSATIHIMPIPTHAELKLF